MARNFRGFAKLAKRIGPSGKVQSTDALDSTNGLVAVSVADTPANLSLSGNSIGDQAYSSSNNSLYIWNGTGWYRIALINTAPSITDGGAGSYALSTDGTPTVITLEATDPEEVPLTWTYQVTSGSLGSIATVTQADNVFTITPSTESANAGDFTITFTASDGVNTATASNTFSLTFTDPNWDLVKFSLQTESDTVTDKVSPAATLTLHGNSASSTHTKLDPQSLELPGTTNGVLVDNPTLQPMNFGTGFWTVEFFFYHYYTPVAYSGFWTAGTNNDGFSFGWGANAGTVRLKMLDNTVSSQSFGVSLAYNQWHHFAVTRGPAAAGQSNHRMTVWHNGSKVDHVNIGETEVVNSTVGNNGAFWIGKTLAESTSYLVKGWIDNFQVSHYCKYVDDGTSTTYTVPAVDFGPTNA